MPLARSHAINRCSCTSWPRGGAARPCLLEEQRTALGGWSLKTHQWRRRPGRVGTQERSLYVKKGWDRCNLSVSGLFWTQSTSCVHWESIGNWCINVMASGDLLGYQSPGCKWTQPRTKAWSILPIYIGKITLLRWVDFSTPLGDIFIPI